MNSAVARPAQPATTQTQAVTAEPPDKASADTQYLVTGYAILWAVIFLYVLVLHLKTGRIRRKLYGLEQALDRLEDAPS